MKNLGKALFIILFLFSIKNGIAQDSPLSGSTSSPLLLNPATTGYFHSSSLRIWVNHRDQWSSFLSKGLMTSNISFDMPISEKNIAIGAFISNSMTQKGAINNQEFLGSFSYILKLSNQSTNFLSFGLQAGIRQHSIKPDKLNWESQFVDGTGFDNTIDHQEGLTGNVSKILPDFNTGVLWFSADRWKKLKPWAGISVYHLLSPNQSFTGFNDRIPRKYQLYAGAEYQITQMFGIKPQLLLMNQLNLTQANIGASVSYSNFKSKNSSTFEIGAFIRSNDAVIMMLGFEFSHFKCMLDYDITNSSLKSFNNGNGAFEITVVYMKKPERLKSQF